MTPLIFAFFALAAAPAFAQEPSGCDKFKWPLDQERALLAKPSQIASGGELAQTPAAALLSLVPLAKANLPLTPSRAPRYSDSYAGFLRAPAPQAGTYRITLSHAAWTDVVQDGHELRSVAFTGARDCSGLAKSVKFELAAAPFVIQVSGTSAHAIALAVTAD
ncbi:MAG TPA: hypothetical protein VKV77_09705 [Methylovirgula sp.]|nr:hypothetical protein [Methylovirgula sp.]